MSSNGSDPYQTLSNDYRTRSPKHKAQDRDASLGLKFWLSVSIVISFLAGAAVGAFGVWLSEQGPSDDDGYLALQQRFEAAVASKTREAESCQGQLQACITSCQGAGLSASDPIVQEVVLKQTTEVRANAKADRLQVIACENRTTAAAARSAASEAKLQRVVKELSRQKLDILGRLDAVSSENKALQEHLENTSAHEKLEDDRLSRITDERAKLQHNINKSIVKTVELQGEVNRSSAKNDKLLKAIAASGDEEQVDQEQIKNLTAENEGYKEVEQKLLKDVAKDKKNISAIAQGNINLQNSVKILAAENSKLQLQLSKLHGEDTKLHKEIERMRKQQTDCKGGKAEQASPSGGSLQEENEDLRHQLKEEEERLHNKTGSEADGSSWHLAELDQSCTAACKKAGLVCSARLFQDHSTMIDTEEGFSAVVGRLGKKCTEFADWAAPSAPIRFIDGTCGKRLADDSASGWSCSVVPQQSVARRLCICSEEAGAPEEALSNSAHESQKKTGQACEDVPADWADKAGQSCSTYTSRDYCTSTGRSGPGWSEQWGLLSSFAANGFDATTACCGCGRKCGCENYTVEPTPAPSPSKTNSSSSAKPKESARENQTLRHNEASLFDMAAGLEANESQRIRDLHEAKREVVSLRGQVALLATKNDQLQRSLKKAADATSAKQDQASGLLPVPAKTDMPNVAFITMAWDDPSMESSDYLWRILPLARALQHHCSYPLVVLTNATTLPDGKVDIVEGLRRLNAYVMPVQSIDLPEDFSQDNYAQWKVALWKLQIWGLTRFEKLVWLDSDSLVTRSLDFMFSLDWMWAQRDDWFCEMNQKKVCSGLLLLYPNVADYLGLQAHAVTKDKWEHGDQELISSYFQSVREKPINLLSDDDASFGQCVGKAPTVYISKDGSPVPGLWSTPAYVHKSGGWGGANDDFSNICFSHLVWRQYQDVGGITINVCHFHPMGPYWRDLFCQAVHGTGVKAAESEAFCDDGCWFKGRASEGLELGLLDKSRWCRPIVSAVGDHVGVGQPVFMSEDGDAPRLLDIPAALDRMV